MAAVAADKINLEWLNAPLISATDPTNIPAARPARANSNSGGPGLQADLDNGTTQPFQIPQCKPPLRCIGDTPNNTNQNPNRLKGLGKEALKELGRELLENQGPDNCADTEPGGTTLNNTCQPKQPGDQRDNDEESCRRSSAPARDCETDDLVHVYRAPQRGNGPDELANGLNPTRHEYGNGRAYVGTQDVALRYADYSVGTHEDGYIKFTFRRPDFEENFGTGYPYEGGPGREWEIPYEQIDTFNRLTVSREWIYAPW
ncbi:hypothetical protein [Frankia sp. CcI49]|uniref:hypothetical protein n=1 Tax=Frankia sp. CcI49 TaxID=1745382 RepID=UPI0010552B59|nr:hypothetical protein [Frankia sp. CcI49]